MRIGDAHATPRELAGRGRRINDSIHGCGLHRVMPNQCFNTPLCAGLRHPLLCFNTLPSLDLYSRRTVLRWRVGVRARGRVPAARSLRSLFGNGSGDAAPPSPVARCINRVHLVHICAARGVSRPSSRAERVCGCRAYGPALDAPTQGLASGLVHRCSVASRPWWSAVLPVCGHR